MKDITAQVTHSSGAFVAVNVTGLVDLSQIDSGI
jgi:hypothetical protein